MVSGGRGGLLGVGSEALAQSAGEFRASVAFWKQDAPANHRGTVGFTGVEIEVGWVLCRCRGGRLGRRYLTVPGLIKA